MCDVSLNFKTYQKKKHLLEKLQTSGNIVCGGYIVFYDFQDLFDGNNYGTLLPDSKFEVKVNSEGNTYVITPIA